VLTASARDRGGGGGYCAADTINLVNVGCGTVFKLASNGSGGYTESALYGFSGASAGAIPCAGLIMDSAGNLYGTTTAGGNSSCSKGCGTVFKLAPNGTGGRGVASTPGGRRMAPTPRPY
jgi:uncharacterized repeat protein (TIGR03803 family)